METVLYDLPTAPAGFVDPALASTQSAVLEADEYVIRDEPLDASPRLYLELSRPDDFPGSRPEEVHTPPLMDLLGESFEVESDDGVVVIQHPRWSLIGSGTTVLEAEADLLSCAREVAPLYVGVPLDSLSIEALEFRDFLIRNVV